MKRPRILFVAMTDSIHTARWLAEVCQLDYDIHIFPSDSLGINPGLCDASLHGFYFVPGDVDRSLRFPSALPVLKSVMPNRLNMLTDRFRRLFSGNRQTPEGFKARQLARVIKNVRPDLIHTLEMQHAGYLALEAKKLVTSPFPAWIYTPWGSDIYLFGRLPDHVDRVKAVLASCDYIWPQADRDMTLAREFGFHRKFLPLIPSHDGFDTRALRSVWQPGPCSDRTLIMVKGYQGRMGRALVALRALELCADVLKGFSVVVYSATDDVKAQAERLSRDAGIQVTILPQCSRNEMLRLFGKARVSLGLSISDGVPNSMLESMVMGTFPVESTTSCADEWIVSGQDGFIVPPEDPKAVADALRRAVTDDQLVDHAAERNFSTMCSRMDNSVIRPEILAGYRHVFETIRQGDRIT